MTTDAGVFPGALVLRDPLFIASTLHHRRPVPLEVLDPPPGWQRVAVFERARRPHLRDWWATERAASPPAASLWRVNGDPRRAGVVGSGG